MSKNYQGDEWGREDNGIPFTRAGSIRPAKRKWLISPLVSCGSITVLTGSGGVGKSTLLATIAAHVSGGKKIRDSDTPEVTGGVAILVGEESASISVRPRLEAAGANMRRVYFPGTKRDGQAGKPLTMPADLHHLRPLFAEHRIRMVIVDPLVSFALGCDLMSQQGSRLLMGHLQATATACDLTWLLVVHPTKLRSGPLVNRISLSASIVQQARSVMWLAEHPTDDSLRAMIHIKTNEGQRSPALDFRMKKTPESSVPPTLVYVGLSTVSESRMDNPAEDGVEEDARADARELLRRLLGDDWRPCQQVMKEAREAGVGERTLRSAKVAMGVRSRRATGELMGVCWEWGPPENGWPS